VVNERELLDVASEFDFQKVRPETMSLREQIELFAGADAVLGPHGAGLLNGIYAADPTVIELFGTYQNPCYFALFSGIGVKYAAILCDPIDGDIKVDPDDLERLLARLL
jgi:hypothetical protein